MTRLILIASAAIAALTLAACNQASVMAKAQTGDCYQVLSKNSLGEPQLAKTNCGAADATTAGTPAADGTQAAATGAPSSTTPGASTAAAGASQPAAICPKTCEASATGAAASSGQESEASEGPRSYIARSSSHAKQFVRTTGRGVGRSRANGGETGLGLTYARVPQGADEGSSVGEAVYATSGQGADYAGRASSGSSYSEQSSTSSSSSYSTSSSSESTSGGRCCTAGYPARGPHWPFDENGYLTWRDKVEYQPAQPRR